MSFLDYLLNRKVPGEKEETPPQLPNIPSTPEDDAERATGRKMTNWEGMPNDVQWNDVYEPEPAEPVMPKAKSPNLDNYLRAIAEIESSGGKNTKHVPVDNAEHQGESAYGKYALMPKTVRQLATKFPDLEKENPGLGGLQGAEMHKYLASKEGLEDNLQRRLTEDNQKIVGDDPRRLALAHYAGAGQGKNADLSTLPEDQKNYVQKFLKAMNSGGAGKGMADSLQARSGDAPRPSSPVESPKMLASSDPVGDKPKSLLDSVYGMDLGDAALAAAQDKARTNRLIAGLGNAGLTIGNAIAGTKIPGTGFDTIEKNAGKDAEDILTRRKGKTDETEFKLKQISLATEEEKGRPETGVSQAARDLYEKYTGKKAPVSATAKSLEEVLKLAEKGWEVDGKAKTAAAEKAKLTPKQVSDISSFDKPIAMLKGLLSEKGKYNTGPIAGRVHALADMMGMQNDDKAAFKSQTVSALAKYMHDISGTAVNEGEVARLMLVMPTLNDDDGKFIKKTNNLIKELSTLKDVELENIRKSGKDISEFRNDAGRSPQGGSDTVTFQASDGRTLTIPKKNLEAAQKRDPGLKVIN